MKQSRFTDGRIIAILREHEAGSKTWDVRGPSDESPDR
jgi:hypothetical protein